LTDHLPMKNMQWVAKPWNLILGIWKAW